MKGKRTSSGKRKLLTGEDLDRLYPTDIEALKRRRIDYSDIPKTDAAFWADAEWILPGQKVALGVRFDTDVVEWFKSLGTGYQTKMNAVLRLYMDHHKKTGTKPPSPSKRKKS